MVTETTDQIKTCGVGATSPRNVPDVVSRSILRVRKRLEMSQALLAMRAGISRSTLNRIESGQNRDMCLGTLVAIGDALAVTPDELLGYRSAS